MKALSRPTVDIGCTILRLNMLFQLAIALQQRSASRAIRAKNTALVIVFVILILDGISLGVRFRVSTHREESDSNSAFGITATMATITVVVTMSSTVSAVTKELSGCVRTATTTASHCTCGCSSFGTTSLFS